MHRTPSHDSRAVSNTYEDAVIIETRAIELQAVEKDAADVIDVLSPPPDAGALAWMVVAGAFLVHCIADGILSSFGVFLEYYTNVAYKDQAPASTLAFIGTITVGTNALFGAVAGRLADRLGYRVTMILGNCISTVALVLASFSTEVWHLFLTQGFMLGAGLSMIIVPALSAPNHWFRRKAGLALGITVAGSGIGGLALSPAIAACIASVGIQWTLRALALLCLAGNFIAIALVRTRKAPSPSKSDAPERFWDFGLYRNRQFQAILFCILISELSFSTPSYILPLYSVHVGLSATQGAIIVGAMSGASAIGRIAFGVLGDRLGSINILLVCTSICGASIIAMWIPATTFPFILAFAIVYGAANGGFACIFTVVVSDIFGAENIASTLGKLYTPASLTTFVGAPLTAAIVAASGGDYTWAILFAGSSALIGSLGALYLACWTRSSGHKERVVAYRNSERLDMPLDWRKDGE